MSTITYTEAHENLAALLDEVSANRETVVIQRTGQPDVAMVPAEDLSSFLETAHLLRSPRNAARLLSALQSARAGEGIPMTLEELRAAVGLDATAS